MNRQSSHGALETLLQAVQRSLPMYLTYAAPFAVGSDAGAVEALRRIAEQQQEIAGRISQRLIELYGRADGGVYPMQFTDLHDLSVDFLLRRLVEHQRKDIATIESAAARLAANLADRALANEALGAAKGHLETLEELLARSPAAGKSS